MLDVISASHCADGLAFVLEIQRVPALHSNNGIFPLLNCKI
jgi:hypothetical protein